MLKNYHYAKKLFRQTFMTIFVLVTFFVSVSAQAAVSVSISTKLKILKTEAGEKLKTTSYRLIQITKNAETNEMQRKIVCEFVLPDQQHCIEESYSYSEWIYIADKFFFRNGAKEKWELLPEDKYDGYINIWMGEGRQERFGINTKLKYKFTLNQEVKNQRCDLYEIISTFQFQSQTFEGYSEGFCFNKAGFIVSIYAKSDPFKTTIDYEYDQNIKIKAPSLTEQGN